MNTNINLTLSKSQASLVLLSLNHSYREITGFINDLNQVTHKDESVKSALEANQKRANDVMLVILELEALDVEA